MEIIFLSLSEINWLVLRLWLSKLLIVAKGLMNVLRIAIPRRQWNALFHRRLALVTFGILLPVFRIDESLLFLLF